VFAVISTYLCIIAVVFIMMEGAIEHRSDDFMYRGVIACGGNGGNGYGTMIETVVVVMTM
jgi:hypothetical protein